MGAAVISVVLCTARGDPPASVTGRTMNAIWPVVWSLQQQTYRAIELVVVDLLHPDPAKEELLKESGLQFQYLPVRDTPWRDEDWRVRCLSACRNTGIEAAGGTWLFMMDDCCVLAPRTLEVLAGHLDRGEVVSPAWHRAESLPTGLDDLALLRWASVEAERSWYRWVAESPEAPSGPAPRTSGTHSLVAAHRELWAVLGGFEELLDGCYGCEDCDLSDRMSKTHVLRPPWMHAYDGPRFAPMVRPSGAGVLELPHNKEAEAAFDDMETSNPICREWVRSVLRVHRRGWVANSWTPPAAMLDAAPKGCEFIGPNNRCGQRGITCPIVTDPRQRDAVARLADPRLRAGITPCRKRR